MSNRFAYGMQSTEAIRQLNGLDDDVAAAKTAGAANASLAVSSAASAAAARDAAIAAWQASTAPTEQLAAMSKVMHQGAVVEVFMYDTSRDSDGGAWRKRCKHTSWENETLVSGKWLGLCADTPAAIAAGGVVGDYFQATVSGAPDFWQITGTSPQAAARVYRGNTREFPALALLVLEAKRLVIYDATQPSLPMWMVFNSVDWTKGVPVVGDPAQSAVSVVAANSCLWLGHKGAISGTVYGGITRIAFSADVPQIIAGGSWNYTFKMNVNIANRNTGSVTNTATSGGGVLSNSEVTDLAVAILPDAPTDLATGLPVPTIAVGTASGIAVLKHDGTVINSGSGAPMDCIRFTERYTIQFNYYGHCSETVPITTATAGFGSSMALVGAATGFSVGGNTIDNPLGYSAGCSKDAISGGGGLTRVKRGDTAARTMLAAITNAYNSGWQVGDSRGAWLADTTAEVLASANLLTGNDANYATGIGNWAVQASATVTWDAANGVGGTGAAALTSLGGSSVYSSLGFTGLTVGKRYAAFLTVKNAASASAYSTIKVSTGLFNSGTNVADVSIQSTPTYATKAVTFVATAATCYLSVYAMNGSGEKLYVDNVEVRLADADRSVKNVSFGAYGSITKAAVAAGAQLVGYSGFSASNYLEQPYNSALDFGTGDFCIMGWAIPAAAGDQTLFFRATSTGSATPASGINMWMYGAGALVATQVDGVGLSTPTNTLVAGQPHLIELSRKSGTLSLYVNGVLKNNASNGGNVSLANSFARIGAGFYTDTGHKLALWRASATVPSADQRAQIYRDELALFQPGAQCTVDGTGLSVYALAYDDITDLLHVGTAWGRSAFKGLQRVESSATAIGTINTLSVSRGAHITGAPSGARFMQPAQLLRDELLRKDEARRAMAREEIPIDFDGQAGQTAFTLPIGFITKGAFVAGTKKRAGATKDYTTSYDGYRETVNFGVSPGATWVQITANRSI